MKKYLAFLFVAFIIFSCADGVTEAGFDENEVSTGAEISARNKEEVKEFKYLTDYEKNVVASMVRSYDNQYLKGYAELADGYAGTVYYSVETTKILLESTFSSFSDTRWLRFNQANAQALFVFMGFRYVDYPSPAPAPAKELRSTFSGITFILPLAISEKIMSDYNCTFAVIENAMGRVASTQGGNGIRVSVEANKSNYTSELKIQVMGDKRVFTKDTGTQRTFTIFAAGLH